MASLNVILDPSGGFAIRIASSGGQTHLVGGFDTEEEAIGWMAALEAGSKPRGCSYAKPAAPA